MTFARPWWLLLAIAVLVLGAGYLWAHRRTRKHTVRFANLALLDTVVPQRPRWWRHIGFNVVLVGLILLVVALAGPTAEAKVPRNKATVMLAIDVSLSMKATDVPPTRLKAAQDAAIDFVDELNQTVNLGVLSFAGIATVLLSPTTDREPARQAISSLTLDQRTATGEAIISSLKSIDVFRRAIAGEHGTIPARIVLMTDGKRTFGRSETDAAARAKSAGVPISVIAFGTDHASIEVEGEDVPVPLDTRAMRQIAAISGGDFHTAHTADELRKVYSQLGEQIGYETKQRDASRPWLLAGTIVAMIGSAMALATSGRIP